MVYYWFYFNCSILSVLETSSKFKITEITFLWLNYFMHYKICKFIDI